MEPVERIALSSSVYETDALLLSYTGMVIEVGIEPNQLAPRVYKTRCPNQGHLYQMIFWRPFFLTPTTGLEKKVGIFFGVFIGSVSKSALHGSYGVPSLFRINLSRTFCVLISTLLLRIMVEATGIEPA